MSKLRGVGVVVNLVCSWQNKDFLHCCGNQTDKEKQGWKGFLSNQDSDSKTLNLFKGKGIIHELRV